MIVLKVTYFTTQEWCSHSSKLVIVYLKLVQVIELYFQRNYNHAYLRLRQELLSVPMSGNRFEPVSSFLFLCCSPVGILMFETWGWGCKRSPHFFTLDNFFAFESFVQKWRVTGRRTFRSDVNGLLHNLTASCTILWLLVCPHSLLYNLTASCTTSQPLVWTHGLLHDLTASCTILRPLSRPRGLLFKHLKFSNQEHKQKGSFWTHFFPFLFSGVGIVNNQCPT